MLTQTKASSTETKTLIGSCKMAQLLQVKDALLLTTYSKEKGGVLPHINHIGMCRPKGYHLQAFWSEL